MRMEFDRDFLDMGVNVDRRVKRDGLLKAAGVQDLDAFKARQRQLEVDNECGSDEYRETQPSKGLGMISDFLADFAPGTRAVNEVIYLTKVWIVAVDQEGGSYAGDRQLVPILEAYFDFRWGQGYYSLYDDGFDYLDQAVKWYLEEEGGK